MTIPSKKYTYALPGDDHEIAKRGVPAGFRAWFVSGWSAPKGSTVMEPKGWHFDEEGEPATVADLKVGDQFFALQKDRPDALTTPMVVWRTCVLIEGDTFGIIFGQRTAEWANYTRSDFEQDPTFEIFGLAASASVPVWRIAR